MNQIPKRETWIDWTRMRCINSVVYISCNPFELHLVSSPKQYVCRVSEICSIRKGLVR